MFRRSDKKHFLFPFHELYFFIVVRNTISGLVYLKAQRSSHEKISFSSYKKVPCNSPPVTDPRVELRYPCPLHHFHGIRDHQYGHPPFFRRAFSGGFCLLLSSLRPCIFCPLFFRPVCSFWKVFWRPKLTKPPKNCCLQAYTVNPMRIWKHRPSGICGTGLLENWMTG